MQMFGARHSSLLLRLAFFFFFFTPGHTFSFFLKREHKGVNHKAYTLNA